MLLCAQLHTALCWSFLYLCPGPSVPGRFFGNLAQTTVTLEEGVSTEEFPPSDWTVDMFVGVFWVVN